MHFVGLRFKRTNRLECPETDSNHVDLGRWFNCFGSGGQSGTDASDSEPALELVLESVEHLSSYLSEPRPRADAARS